MTASAQHLLPSLQVPLLLRPHQIASKSMALIHVSSQGLKSHVLALQVLQLLPSLKPHIQLQAMWSAPKPTMASASSQRKELSAKCAEFLSQMESPASAQDSFLRRRLSVSQEALRDSAMFQAQISSAPVKLQRLSSKIVVMLLPFLKRRHSQISTLAWDVQVPAFAKWMPPVSNALVLQSS